jgi:oligosaccharide repeat unit polymerase
MVSAIAFIIAFLCLLESTLLKKDFFNPCRVYIFTQSITLGIAYLKLHPAMTDFHILTWAVLLGGMFSFVIGCYTMSLVFEVKPSTSHNRFSSFENYKWSLHCFFAFILFLLYLLPAKILMDYAGGVPLFSSKLSSITSIKIFSVTDGWLLYPLSFASLVIILFGVASFRIANPNKYLRGFSRFMVILQVVAMILFYPTRNALFISIACLAILWNYLKKTISSKILMLGMAILLGVFISIAYAKEQSSSNSSENFTIDYAIQVPYVYIANNFWNLDNALDPPFLLAEHSATYGLDHFAGSIPIFGNSFRKAFDWDSQFNETISKIYKVNTVNYLWEIYKDFGGMGVAFVPFFWGLLITWLHIRLKMNLQMKYLLLYSLAITMVGLWWFSIWYKTNFMYGIWILVILGITALCQKKTNLKYG